MYFYKWMTVCRVSCSIFSEFVVWLSVLFLVLFSSVFRSTQHWGSLWTNWLKTISSLYSPWLTIRGRTMRWEKSQGFSLMFIHVRPQWSKQKGMCFSVYEEPERTWRKIYRCVNILHESLVYSVLFTTCSNTVLITSPRPTSHDTNILCFLSSPYRSPTSRILWQLSRSLQLMFNHFLLPFW